MEEIRLDVQVRKEIGKQGCSKVRRESFIPGVVYGAEQKSTSIQMNRTAFERIERQHKGQSIVLYLGVMDGDKKLKDYPTIIKEIQYDPVTDKILHVDFNSISLTKEIEVKVPVVAKGDSIGVKKEGGSLDHHIWELTVMCLPTKIPRAIEVDVSRLNINDSIYVKDLLLPEGVKTKQDPEDIVMTVVPPMKEEVPVGAEVAAGVEELEVIKEKKKEEVPAAGEEKAGKEKEKPKEEKPEGK